MNTLTERWPSLKREGIVTDPAFWATSAGYEFQINFGHLDLTTVMAATNEGLSGKGWTNAIAANAAITEGSTGDFLSAADIDPTRLVVGSTNTSIRSPRIFGSYAHALVAARYIGYQPTKLTMEAYARFSVASANETTSFIGLHTPAGTDIAAAGGGGGVVSNGTNFLLVSDLGSDTGAAIDTNWHLWTLQWTGSTCEWFIDGATQGTTTLETDIWPLSWSVCSGTTNRPQVAWARLYYS